MGRTKGSVSKMQYMTATDNIQEKSTETNYNTNMHLGDDYAYREPLYTKETSNMHE